MNAYTDFAGLYDIFMDNVPYEKWARSIAELLRKYDERCIPEDNKMLASEAGLVVDLGCGTGVLTRILAAQGFDMIGVDSSVSMLDIARSKNEDKSILYLNQDMRELELYSTVGAVISVCDCVNYLLTEEDVLKTFKQVNNYLYPRGLFIFDFNTVHRYRDVYGESVIAENREEGSFIWENYYNNDSRLNEYDLTIYSLREDGTYNRAEETHIQRGYEPEEMTRLVNKAGLGLVRMFDSDTGADVTDESERVCIVAREISKRML